MLRIATLVVAALPASAAAQAGTLKAIVSTSAEATAGAKIICTTPCNVTSIYGVAAGAALYMMTFNQATIPVDGTVAPHDCYG